MDASKALELVKDSLVEQFDLDREVLQPESQLFAELGLDSIDALDLVGILEQRLGSPVPDEELKSIRIVQDVVDLIMRQSGQESAE